MVFAYLFGSRATGTAHSDSDADIAIMIDRRIGLLERERLALDLAEALGSPEADVVVLAEADLELRGKIIQEGRVIFSSDDARRVAFEVETRTDYFDFLPHLQMQTAGFLHRIAERGLHG